MQQTRAGTVIVVGNQKGGVGKTTTAVHLAAALTHGGYRCLLIDLDPAAGATRHLGVPEDRFAGTLELLTGDDSVANLTITEGMPHGVHLIPSRPQLSELDAELSKFADRTMLLERPLAEARAGYDFIILDTAPTAGATTTVAAYSAAEWILLSAFPHPLSLGGLTEAFNDIADVRRRRNPALEVLGVVFTNVDGRTSRLRAELETWMGGGGGRWPRRSELSHDLTLAEVYLGWLARPESAAERWISEAGLTKLGFGDRKRLPDAMIERATGRFAVEVGGEYAASKLAAFHRFCAQHELGYELW